jgi:hypothetical protein
MDYWQMGSRARAFMEENNDKDIIRLLDSKLRK